MLLVDWVTYCFDSEDQLPPPKLIRFWEHFSSLPSQACGYCSFAQREGSLSIPQTRALQVQKYLRSIAMSDAKFSTLVEWLANLQRPELQHLAIDAQSCCICWEPYPRQVKSDESLEGPVALPCGHIFGLDCLSIWLAFGQSRQLWATCPVCRHKLFSWRATI